MKRSPRANAVLAGMEKVNWNLFVFTDDVDDIQDGRWPFGPPVQRTKGYTQAIHFAQLILREDPCVRFVKVVPEISEGGIMPFEVRRRASVTGRQVVDPTRGDEDFRIERRRQRIEEREHGRE